jgi:hypothetical protein
MVSIWKINPLLIRNNKQFNKLYFCDYCCSHVHSNNFKAMLIKDSNPTIKYINNDTQECENDYKPPFEFTRCFICERMIHGIINGPDVFKFITKIYEPNNESSLYRTLRKYSLWYYNDIYDNFGINLIKKFGFDHNQTKNIYQNINEIYGLPSEDIINDKANHITNTINFNLTPNNWNPHVNYMFNFKWDGKSLN